MEKWGITCFRLILLTFLRGKKFLFDFLSILTFSLWPLIVVNEKLIRVMLQMLLSFTKNSVACATAISSSNLISSIVKQFQYYEKQIRNRVKASPIFTLNFNLLCNLSSSQEARAFFWKGTRRRVKCELVNFKQMFFTNSRQRQKLEFILRHQSSKS